MISPSDGDSSLDARRVSVIAGVFGLVVFAGSLAVLSGTTSIDVRGLLVPFSLGFLVFVGFYLVVMVLVEPYLRV